MRFFLWLIAVSGIWLCVFACSSPLSEPEVVDVPDEQETPKDIPDETPDDETPEVPEVPPPPSAELVGTFIFGNPSAEAEFPPLNAFDGDTVTYFRANGTYNWLGIDFTDRYVITSVAYCPRMDMASPDYPDRLRLGLFEGANSADFADAIPLLIISAPAERRMNTASVSCSRGFRYVRFVFPDPQIGGGKSNYIAELKFFGYKSNGNDSQMPQLTNLPTISIRTANRQEISSKTDWVNGSITVVYANGTKTYTDNIEIRGRGNNSWTHPKKPYRVKLATSTNFMGLPAKARNWTLINNYGDKTLMRNIIAFDFSRRIEMPYTSPAEAVDVVLNGDYKGCYQLCDHIDVRKNRVDVEEMSASDVKGGYSIEIDAYAYGDPVAFTSDYYSIPVSVKYPDSEDITAAQIQFIKEHFELFTHSVASTQYTNVTTGFRKYLDTDVFIRRFLLGEYSGSTDMYWSVRMWKKRDSDKFVWAPVWDFDLGFENDWRTWPINTRWGDQWLALCDGTSAAGNTKELIRRILTDSDINTQLSAVWKRYRTNGRISTTALTAVVDSCAALLEQSQQLNFMRWQIMGQKVHENPVVHGSYAAEVENVRNYILKRLEWLDSKLQ
ncbi:MAG: CotH kinase family protein [Bacteroidales bacterium]|jgi:hypothetical protein|nr:CotH kinase family protein [Bacteroidales bacterium]